LFAAVVIVVALSFQSCRKNYTCKCTLTSGTVDAEYLKVKKATAEASCDQLETTYKVSDPSASCDLQ